jgi:hypothetical protein
MNNYNLLNTSELKYLQEIIKQFKKLDDDCWEYFKNRDIRLELILNEDYSKFKIELDKEIGDLKDLINNINIYQLEVNLLEKLAKKINQLHQWWEYFKDKNNETKENRTSKGKSFQ